MTRLEIAQQIVNWEARRDSAGHLKIYPLPASDGGGTFEVAGINDKYHPAKARELANLIRGGAYAEAERRAVEYIASYTDAADWSTLPGIDVFLRDCAFNRGVGGAGKILQIALGGLEIDGAVGPKTIAALRAREARPFVLLARLRCARERYEERVAPGRPEFRAGLENRWDNCTEVAAQALMA